MWKEKTEQEKDQVHKADATKQRRVTAWLRLAHSRTAKPGLNSQLVA